MKYVLIFISLVILSCGRNQDPNDLGIVEILPSGEYTIWNYGSRHLVKCLRPDGKYYYLNDNDFEKNGIDGHDAHQYHDKTKIIIK